MAMQELDDLIQIFFIRQDRSLARYNISQSLHEYLMSVNQVFLPFWKCVFACGRKAKENNFEFPPFQFRRTLIDPNESFGKEEAQKNFQAD